MNKLTEIQKKLVEENINLAYKFVSTKGLKYDYDYDESLSIAFLGLVKASLYYNSEKSKFSTYAYLCIEQQFLLQKRRERAKKRDILLVSLNEVQYQGVDGSEIALEDMLADNEDLINSVITQVTSDDILLNKLNEREKEVIKLLYQGKKQREVAKILNTSQPYVSRVLKKFKKLLYC